MSTANAVDVRGAFLNGSKRVRECAWRPFSPSCRPRWRKARALSPKEAEIRLPQSKEEIIEQAYHGVLAAWRAGQKRQTLEILLPIIGATELDDWPGGIRQESQAATPMMEDLLRRLKKEENLQGSLIPETWDAGDAVGCWKSPKLGLILFLTAETLRKAKDLASQLDSDGLLVIVNPQWRDGQLLSDLGIGPWKRRNEEFMASFAPTYTLKRLRMSGDNVRLIRRYPGKWHVYLTSTAGDDELLSVQDVEPTYKELQELLRKTPSANSSKSLAERIQSEFAFNRDSLKG